MSNIPLSDIIMIVGFIITIATFYLGRKNDTQKEVAERTKMYTKIDSTCNSISEILRSIDKMTNKFDELSKRQVSHDEQIRSLYKNYEALEKRVSKLEDKQ